MKYNALDYGLSRLYSYIFVHTHNKYNQRKRGYLESWVHRGVQESVAGRDWMEKKREGVT